MIVMQADNLTGEAADILPMLLKGRAIATPLPACTIR